MLAVALAVALSFAILPPSAQEPPAQAPTGQVGGLDPKVADEIRVLRGKAREAERRDDLPKALSFLDEIVRKDPNDNVAWQEAKALRDKVAAKQKDEQDKAAAQERRARFNRDLDAIQAQIRRARLQEDRALLEKARDGLARARNLAEKGGFLEDVRAEVDKTDEAIARLEAEFSWIEYGFWIGIGVVVLAAAVGTFLFFWRRTGRLEMLAGPVPGQTFVLRKEATSIGNVNGEVDWPLANPQRRISRHHCDFLRRGRHYWIVDQSTNGTFVNGRVIPRGEAVLLKRGDQIGLGHDIILRFV